MSTEALTYTPELLFARNSRQLEAWKESWQHRFLLYGGAAGGGKSFFLRWWCVFYLIVLYKVLGIRGAQVGLLCEDYPSLRDRQVSSIEREFPPELGKLRRGDTLDFTLDQKWGGGVIMLRNLDDPAKYLSSQFAGIAVDELTRNEQSVFDWLRLRLRWPGVEKPRFVGATNPGGKGHGWVKKLWLDGELPTELKPLKNEFAFIGAKAKDNPFLNESYYEDLKTLPGPMAKAYMEGRWDLFVGQYFDIFRPTEHVRRAESFGLKAWYPRWLSIDWGFQHPSAVYWHTRLPSGATATYRELVVNHLSPPSLARAIAEENDGETIETVYLSPDAFAQRTSEATISEQLSDVFHTHSLPGCTRADDDRVGGWMLMYQLLQSGHWLIGDSCPKLIKCLPNLVRDEKKVEDVAKMDGDDEADSVRYGLKSRLQPGEMPLREVVESRIIKFAEARNTTVEDLDINAVAMLSRRAHIDEFRKRRARRGGLGRVWHPQTGA